MNKYTTLLQKYLKIVVFGSLVLGLFFAFGQFFHASSNLQDSASRDPSTYKAAFFTAMQESDLAKGRAAYEKLASLLPAEDPFLTEIAPAYLADLYLKYAQTLSFDPKAYALMLAQAEHLSPKHPLLLIMKAAMPEEAVIPEEPMIAQAPVSEALPDPTLPALALLAEPVLQPTLAALPEPIKDGPPRIPYIDPPPLSVQFMYPEIEIPPAAPPTVAAAPATSDPCALSFYTKTNALTACIDPVGANRYGPALFVVADPRNLTMVAFTQQAITHQDYDVFCEATGQCYEEAQQPEPLIDLSDVQEAVYDYNAYCQMTGSCDKIVEKEGKKRSPLTRGQIQRYALWLTKQTGYKYHHPSEQETASIKLYFQECVNARICQAEVLQNLGGILSQQDNILVREVAKM